MQRPIEYRDHAGHIWHATEVAQLRVVSPAIDGPTIRVRWQLPPDGYGTALQPLKGADEPHSARAAVMVGIPRPRGIGLDHTPTGREGALTPIALVVV